MHSSLVSLCKCINCMLVYAGVNCFVDRNETKEKFRVAKVLIFFVPFISKFL